jgi:hypothetical protein
MPGPWLTPRVNLVFGEARRLVCPVILEHQYAWAETLPKRSASGEKSSMYGRRETIMTTHAPTGLRSIDVQRDQFLFPTSRVAIEVDEPLDAVLARRAVGVARGIGKVAVSRDRRRLTWSPSGLTPGRHVLEVDPLIAASGDQVAAGRSIPFSLVDSAAPVPRNVIVESMVRLRAAEDGVRRLSLYERPRGRWVELMKGTDRRTGAPVALAFDEEGHRLDAERLLAELERKRAERLGKLHPHLAAQLRRIEADESIRVAIWAAGGEPVEPDDRPVSVTEAQEASDRGRRRRRVNAERTQRLAQSIEELGGRDLVLDSAAPVVFARMTKRAVTDLARREDVAGVFLYDPEGVVDLEDSMAIANSDDVHGLGVDGTGIRVAVWETGPDDEDDLQIEDRYTSASSGSASDREHSRLVHGIVKNVESGAPHGHAPDCDLYSANSKDLAALAWAVNEVECTVVNQSFHRSSEPEEATMSFDDIYKDWLALRWPFPTILQAAGNYWETDPDDIDPPADEYVNHKGFNSLTVGNHNDDASGMSSTSVFRNPSAPHGDRELPEISANGTGVAAVGLRKSGTSMASPAAAGVTALLQDTNFTLRHWPEGCRAILLAGASRNVVGDSWWQDVIDGEDASDGAGAVDALQSHRIAQSRRSRNASGTRRGWDVGSLSSGDFDGSGLSTFSYRVQVPSMVLGPRHVKVALAWVSKVQTFDLLGITIPISSKLTVDLDLKVFDSSGVQVGYSGSYDNSHEIAEFDGHRGETYDIRIRRWSGTDWVWYGIAWTVTGGLLDVIQVIDLDSIHLRALADALDGPG